jgi:hypothetical protein
MNDYANSYLIRWLGFEPFIALVDQCLKLGYGGTFLHNASNLGLVHKSILGDFDIWI